MSKCVVTYTDGTDDLVEFRSMQVYDGAYCFHIEKSNTRETPVGIHAPTPVFRFLEIPQHAVKNIAYIQEESQESDYSLERVLQLYRRCRIKPDPKNPYYFVEQLTVNNYYVRYSKEDDIWSLIDKYTGKTYYYHKYDVAVQILRKLTKEE